MTHYWYAAYGMRIQSEVRLAAPPAPAASSPDVVIRLGKVDRGAAGSAVGSTLLRATPDEVSLVFKDIGAFSVLGSREIVVDPLASVDGGELSAWVQGTIISVLLHQRRFLVLHASSVAVGNAAVAFLGEVGWGKSTTAATLCARGHRLLTDDVVAVHVAEDGSAIVVPGFPHVKLLPEAVTFLGGNPQSLPLVAGDAEKRMRILDEGFCDTPVPLRAVFILGEGPACSIDRLAPQAALLDVMRHAFVARMTEFLRLTGTAQSHFAHCTRLVNGTAICALRRPRALALLPTLVEMVEKQVTGGVARAG